MLFEGGHGRIEAFDVTDHEFDVGFSCRGNDLFPFGHAEGDGFLDEQVNAALDDLQSDR